MRLPWATGTRHVLRTCPRRILVRYTYTADTIPLLIFPTSFRRAHTEAPKPSTSNSGYTNTEQDLKLGVNNEASSSTFALDLAAIRARITERANEFTSTASSSLSELGGRLNQLTGYEHIERLKHKVVETEAAIAGKRQAAKDAKAAYEAAVSRRSNSQREVNDLLQRKSSWTDTDVSRFTSLVREDHLCEQEEIRAKEQVELAEVAVDAEFNELMRTILNRYHEEQVWSDKIRSASTYGSLIVLGVNVFVFIIAIMFVEPWKRRRLAETFEKRVEQLSLENRELIEWHMSDLSKRLEAQQQLIINDLGSEDTNQSTSVTEVDDIVPIPSRERTARAALDRELWIAGVIGAVGGAAITLFLSPFR